MCRTSATSRGSNPKLARAERNARILLDAGFTSAYSAGSLLDMPVEVVLRDKIRGGVVPGLRLHACGAERDNSPMRPGGHLVSDWQGPESCVKWVHEKSDKGFDSIKILVSDDDVFLPGGSMVTQPRSTDRLRGSWVWRRCVDRGCWDGRLSCVGRADVGGVLVGLSALGVVLRRA